MNRGRLARRIGKNPIGGRNYTLENKMTKRVRK